VPKDPATNQFYAWREENGDHVQVQRNSPDVRSLIESRALNFLITRSDDKMSLVMLAIP
jgi:hypothetical protein